jgi:hypothetical protein
MIANARRILSAPLAAPLLLSLAVAVSGCSSTFDMLPEKMGGLPAEAPARPAEPKPFPNVYEVRPTREAAPLTTDEQKKLETDLTNLREQQKQLANPPAPPPPPPPPPPPKKQAAPAKQPSATVAAPAKKKPKDPVVPEQTGPVAVPKMVN